MRLAGKAEKVLDLLASRVGSVGRVLAGAAEDPLRAASLGGGGGHAGRVLSRGCESRHAIAVPNMYLLTPAAVQSSPSVAWCSVV